MCMHIYTVYIYIYIYIYIYTYIYTYHIYIHMHLVSTIWTWLFFRCSRNEFLDIPWLLESFSHYTWLLSCPVHCGPSITPGFLAGLISGTSLGLLLGFWCVCRPPAPFFTPAPWHSQSPPSTWSSQTSGEIVRRQVSRIGQYVHE